MTVQTTALSAIAVTSKGEMIKMPMTALVTNPELLPEMAWMQDEALTPSIWGVQGVQAAKKKKEEEEEEEAEEEAGEEDDWEKPEGEEEEEAWDPDFDEFDLPKSGKKTGKGGDEEDEDIKIDEDLNEFDDLFGDSGDDFDDDDDF